MRTPSSTSGALVRGLTLVPAAALIVANVIGTGIFVKARVMTCNVGTPWMVLLAYALAGVFTLAGALTLSELGAMMPRSGGVYNYIGAAFGRVWAFLFGWMNTFINGAGSGAAIAIIFVVFLNDLIGGVLGTAGTRLVAVATIAAITVLNLASVRANGHLSTVLTALKILLVAGIGGVAFVFSDGSWSHFAVSGAGGTCEGVSEGARLGATGFGAAVVGALWSYHGWAVVTNVAEEVHDPGRTLPRALIGSSVLVIGLYVLINAGYFHVLSAEAVASTPEVSSVAGEVMARIVGAAGVSVMAAGLMVSSLGTLHAHILTVARVPFAMARDGMLPRVLAGVSSRNHVPAAAIVLLGACAIGFALSGTFDLITDLVVFAVLVFNGLAVASVYVLRRRMPAADRPYRVWGYPVVPALFLAATLYLMVNTLIATPGRALAGLGIIAIGLPVYAWYARRLPASKAEDWMVQE